MFGLQNEAVGTIVAAIIGKETERGREQNDDISTLVPSLKRYGLNSEIVEEQLKQRLLQIPLAFLERETGLSRQTILRARRGWPLHPAIAEDRRPKDSNPEVSKQALRCRNPL